MENPGSYIPIDRRHSLARGIDLPIVAKGAALFADISGFSSLTAALLTELGLKRGSEELPRLLNLVYDALIYEIHQHGGSVIGFSGDGITCWLDEDDGTQAVTCALAMQRAMDQFKLLETPVGTVVSLGVKVAIAIGNVHRFLVGDPSIQLLETIAGSTLERMADAESLAERGDIIVSSEVVKRIGHKLHIVEELSHPGHSNRTSTNHRIDGADGTGAEPAPEPAIAPNDFYARVTGLTETVYPNTWPPLSTELSLEQIRPWLLPPVYERLQSGGGEFLAEIRPSVALFLLFGGIDFDTDPQAGSKLDTYIRWVQRVLSHYESYLMDVTIGDKGCYLYCSFGSPTLHDDDPARAVAAALELQTPPYELRAIGAVQIGITQGRMRSGAYGGQARRVYGSLGNEVNTAARLMSQAAAGEVVISQQVADAVADLYELKSLGAINVKGKEEPISASLVLGPLEHARPQSSSRFTGFLVAREAELAQLVQFLIATEANQRGQVIRIEGVAGIGKSHLSTAFARQSMGHGWQVVFGTCYSIHRNRSYHAWQQVFRTLFALSGVDAAQDIASVRQTVETFNPDWLVRLPLLAELLNVPIPNNATTAAFEPQLRQEALCTFAIDLIGQWALEQPLHLLIEDAQWLDEASQNLIVTLCRVVSQSRLLLTIVQRPSLDYLSQILPELDLLPNYHLMKLDELTRAGVLTVIANRLKGQPAPILIDLIVSHARGNPFFVEEMTDTLREAGHLVQQEDRLWTLTDTLNEALRQANCLSYNQSGQMTLNLDVPLSAANLGLPDSIQQVVLSRLDRLLAEERLTLKVASVIGRVFDFHLLFRAHPVEQVEKRVLDHLEVTETRDITRLEMPSPNLSYLFKHNITRDVVYETLLESQQRELHQSVAEAMEEISPKAVEQLAYHYTRAHKSDKAMIYLGLSAQKAQNEYANQTALTFYEQALLLDERWIWRKGQIEVLHLLGRREEERIALENLEGIADAPPLETAYLWANYYEAIANYHQAQVSILIALEAARATQDRLSEIRCLGQLGLIARRRGDYAAAKDWYERALEDFDSQKDYLSVEGTAYAQILNGLGIVHRQQSEFEQAKAYYEETLLLSRSGGNLQVEAEGLNSLGVTAFYLRKLTEASNYYQQSLSIREGIGDRAGVGTTLFNLAMAVRNGGDYDQAQLYYSEALSIQQALGNRWEEVNIWNSMGVSYQELGDYFQAQNCLQKGVDLAIEIGDEVGVAYLLDNMGLVAHDSGNFVKAVEHQSNGIAIARKHAEKHLITNYLYHMSMTNLRLGNLELATEQVQTSLTLRQELRMRLSTTGNLATLGEIYLSNNKLLQALEYAEMAISILDECHGEGPEFSQQDYFICSRIFEAAGQAIRAQAALQSAYELIMTRAGRITDPNLRQSFLTEVAINREIVKKYESNR
ncbi:MAG: tetratricopeptide repeat protein [Chloroflexota bacterium]